MEAVDSTGRGDSSNVRPLLGVPAEQQPHYESTTYLWRRNQWYISRKLILTVIITQALRRGEDHLLLVTQERSIYQLELEECREKVRSHFMEGGVFVPPTPNGMIAPASNAIPAHYSFDFAQQVHYPSNPLQPGPIYFLTPRKAAIFGVCCEVIPRQVNFIIDEASDTGKGANTVVSFLDFFLPSWPQQSHRQSAC